MKSIDEINEKIKKGKVVVVTAEEMIGITKDKGTKKASEYVDVVTTGTFGPMCSSGMFINVGHSKPRIKIGGGKCYLNDVPAYCGIAAVDLYIGATASPDDDPRNTVYPGAFKYGGGHVIEDFISGKNINLVATAYGLSLIHISEPTRLLSISYAVFCLKKKITNTKTKQNKKYNTPKKTNRRVLESDNT